MVSDGAAQVFSELQMRKWKRPDSNSKAMRTAPEDGSYQGNFKFGEFCGGQKTPRIFGGNLRRGRSLNSRVVSH
jgi:hypothetical protein